MKKEKICCVCGHSLENHVDEGDGWRCHSLGQDAYQCECYLRKVGTEAEGIDYYDVQRRIEEQLKDLEGDVP